MHRPHSLVAKVQLDGIAVTHGSFIRTGHGSTGPHESASQTASRTSIGSAVFARLAGVPDTD